jgi:hypothetical protein
MRGPIHYATGPRFIATDDAKEDVREFQIGSALCDLRSNLVEFLGKQPSVTATLGAYHRAEMIIKVNQQ